MIDVKALIEKALNDTKLEILVFGPSVHPPSSDPHIASFQAKREEIKRTLSAEGHSVAYGEDIFDPTLPAHVSDPLLQEVVAMKAADFIVVLVGSPGAVAEATRITGIKELCQKSAFFCFHDHKDGLAVRHLRFAAKHGATCTLVSLPDVQACHLTGAVLSQVRDIQTGKAFLF